MKYSANVEQKQQSDYMYQVLTTASHDLLIKTFSRRGTKIMLYGNKKNKVSRTALENLLDTGSAPARIIKNVEKFIGKKLEVDEYSIKATA